MREIKFRAWDRHREDVQMITWEMMQQSRYAKPGHGWWNDCSYTLMQFTGLKDKNGKEIYEGDLVRAETTVYEVIFETGGWSYRASASARPWWLFGDAETLEVIGNIYEHAHFLEAGNGT